MNESYQRNLIKHYNRLLPREINAIRNWQRSTLYGVIGNILRKTTEKKNSIYQRSSKADINRAIKNINIINKVINESPSVTRDIVVYRGFPIEIMIEAKNNPNGLVSDSFLATTSHIEDTGEAKYGEAVVALTVPPNIKRHVMNDDREHEILIERNVILVDIKQISAKRFTARVKKYTPPPPPVNKTKKEKNQEEEFRAKLTARYLADNNEEINWNNM